MTNHFDTERGAGNRTYYLPGGRFLASQRIPPPEVVPIPQDSRQAGADSHQFSVNSHQLRATIPSHLDATAPCAPDPQCRVMQGASLGAGRYGCRIKGRR